MTETTLIAGAGLAGARCAETLRSRGWNGRIVLVGAERHLPYERPALSKEVLTGSDRDLALHPADWWRERDVELLLEQIVDDIDLERRTARVGGRELAWDNLVIATGSAPRRPFRAPRLHHLRTLDEGRRLARALGPRTRLAVVGAGFIGGEVASAAVDRVESVTLVDPLATPLECVLGREVGGLLARRYRDAGVRLRLGVGVDAVEDRGAATRLHLGDGSILDADVVLVAVGVVPSSPFVAGGIVVDGCGRSALDGVYACGDVAQWSHPLAAGEHVRLEHWASADGQARAVASAIAGEPEPWTAAPYFWSDQFGLRLQHVGLAPTWASVDLDGDEESFAARYRDEHGILRAALLANRPREAATIRRALSEPAWA